MNSLTVIASANSRLQADVMMIRLRQAEIDCSKISVLFPARFVPNAVGCWLRISHSTQPGLGDMIACAGRMRKQAVAAANAPREEHQLADLLGEVGIDELNAELLAERLEQGHILLCVHASHETEASVAWHVFKDCLSDTIAVGALQTGHARPHAIPHGETESLVHAA